MPPQTTTIAHLLGKVTNEMYAQSDRGQRNATAILSKSYQQLIERALDIYVFFVCLFKSGHVRLNSAKPDFSEVVTSQINK